MILKSNKLVNVCRSVEKGAFKDPYNCEVLKYYVKRRSEKVIVTNKSSHKTKSHNNSCFEA